jgi:hypothetical protein
MAFGSGFRSIERAEPCKKRSHHCKVVELHYEAYKSKYDAESREYKLKHHGSTIGHLKRRVAQSLKQ